MIEQYWQEIGIKEKLGEQKIKRPYLGLVKLYKDKIDITNTKDGWIKNMTVGFGAEFSLQNIFKKTKTGRKNTINHKINAFGVGSGGSIINTNNQITLISPTVCSNDLNSGIALNTNCVDYNNKEKVVKKIEGFGLGGMTGSINFESNQNGYELCSDYQTVVKCVFHIEPGEPYYLDEGDNVKIDEAMLFATVENNGVISDPIPFAHCVFAPKFKEKNETFTFEWYIIS